MPLTPQTLYDDTLAQGGALSLLGTYVRSDFSTRIDVKVSVGGTLPTTAGGVIISERLHAAAEYIVKMTVLNPNNTNDFNPQKVLIDKNVYDFKIELLPADDQDLPIIIELGTWNP